MKTPCRNIILVCCLATVAGLFIGAATGCKTTTNPTGVVSIGNTPIDPQATGKAVQIAAKYGALETIRQKPESRVYFQLSAAAIAATIASGDTSPTNVTASLTSVTGNDVVAGAITDALSLYSDFFGKVVSDKLAAQSPYTVPVLNGLAAGIQQAVDMTAP